MAECSELSWDPLGSGFIIQQFNKAQTNHLHVVDTTDILAQINFRFRPYARFQNELHHPIASAKLSVSV